MGTITTYKEVLAALSGITKQQEALLADEFERFRHMHKNHQDVYEVRSMYRQMISLYMQLLNDPHIDRIKARKNLEEYRQLVNLHIEDVIHNLKVIFHNVLSQKEVRGLEKSFGGLKALREINLKVEEGLIFSLIGPNGAGKSTLFNCINGFYRPQAGKIFFNSNEITTTAPHKIARLGIARTFQNVELFEGMTAMDNLLAGSHRWIKTGLTGSGLFGRYHREEVRSRDEALEIFDFLGLLNVEEKIVANLPYGIKKLIEVGRALDSKTQLILLDEPAAGLNDRETVELAKIILDIKNDLGITIILVEHDMNLVMAISDQICVLNFGKKLAEGTPEMIKNDISVIEAYLGAA